MPALTLDRREFLTAATSLALGLAAPPRLAHALSSNVANADWDALAKALDGRVLRNGAPGFAQIATPWNLRFASVEPAAIARCASPDDVRVTLAWAEANGVPLVIRSGGHSYAGFSTTTGLMLDVSQMNQVTYDDATGLARVGGGVRNADVYAALRPVGRAITHGRCSGVGVAGLVLGGGIGFNMRRKGLTCDQLVETEIVTADGAILRCSDTENSDLFWACRGGGGGNFGVNTSFTFQTFPIDVVTVFRVVWTSGLDDVVPALLDLMPTFPDTLGCKFFVDAGPAEHLKLLGQIAGTQEEVAALLAPALRAATPAGHDIRTLPYWDSQDFLSEDGTPEFVRERSRYIYRPMSAEGTRTLLDFLRSFPGTHAGANWKVFLAGGAVAAVPPEATAFVHRKALMISSIELNWTKEDDAGTLARNEEWLAAFHLAMRPHSSHECFQNFIDPDEANYLQAYYGENLARLVEIKCRYDPNDVFHFAQSIPLSL